MNSDIEDLNNIINDNEGKYKKHPLNRNLPEAAVERIASMLLEKLGYDESWPYYCKVARLIPAQTLEKLANDAKEVGKHPGKLFTFLTKNEIARLYDRSEDINS